jgi:uncharacterized membrane protein YgcG
MANPKIEVEIGAVIDGLRKGFGDSVRIIETLEKQALDLDKALRAATDLPEIQSLNAKLAQTKAALSQLKSSGVDPLTKATKGYNAVGIDFARIIQDAPFGIIGVGNNIQQLAFSFQELRNTSTSTSAALKQAFLQIISPGNVLVLVISLITSALTAYQMGLFDSKEETKDLEKETESFDQTLRNLVDSIGAVRQARLEGSKGAADEIVQLDLLNRALTDNNQPQSIRIAAYKKLKEEYPTILSNISQEQALANGLGDAYLKVVNAITQRASAIAIEEKLVELAKQRFDILEKEGNETTLQNTLLKQREDLFKKITERVVVLNKNGTTLAEIFGDQTVDFALVDLGNTLIDVNKQFNLLGNVVAPKTQSELIKNDAATEKLKNNFFDLNLELSDFFELSDKSSESTDKLKRSFEDIGDLGPILDISTEERRGAFFEDVEKQLLSIESGVASTRGIYTENVAAITKSNQALSESLKGTGISSEQFYAAIANGAADGFGSLEEFITALGQTQQFINQTFAILEQGAENTLGDMAFAIGDALASGGNVIKAAGAALLGGLAGILNQLGQLAIATGLAVEGIKKALQTLNPAVAIGAGIALVALAGFVSNKAKSLGSSKGGGGGGGGGSSVGSSGVGGGSSFTGTGAQGGMFAANRDLNGELVVRGQDLVYVFGQANNRINKG